MARAQYVLAKWLPLWIKTYMQIKQESFIKEWYTVCKFYCLEQIASLKKIRLEMTELVISCSPVIPHCHPEEIEKIWNHGSQRIVLQQPKSSLNDSTVDRYCVCRQKKILNCWFLNEKVLAIVQFSLISWMSLQGQNPTGNFLLVNLLLKQCQTRLGK